MTTEAEELAKGYSCECGAWHRFPAYVYAHWDIGVNHKCDSCGRENSLLKGAVIHSEVPPHG